MTYRYIPLSEIQRIRKEDSDPLTLCAVLSDIFRINTLYMIKRAGSGHIGTSLSVIDIFTYLWTKEMVNPNEEGLEDTDLFFSSKGHDVPALYAVLIGLEKLDFDFIHSLRRLNGLPGHPDVETPYIVTNTGSLGMGISKARGMAIARRSSGRKGKIFVILGDGELQEGHFWESLQPAANGQFSEITAIVDNNKIQSDTWVRDVSDLGDLEEKLRSFGWEVITCDGHDFSSLKQKFAVARSVTDRPQIIIADTTKGKGVSFMEGRSGMNEKWLYNFHGGALTDEQYVQAIEEIINRVNGLLQTVRAGILRLESAEPSVSKKMLPLEKLTSSYGDELVKIAEENEHIISLDGDLVVSTGQLPFKEKFPERFIECGIAEQDMVSLAGGLALEGKIPVVHSLACFLSARPNEQIYNNATEGKKIIYVGSLAGLLPGFTGHSHQSVRDISALGAVPGLTLIQPSNGEETRYSLRFAVVENQGSTYIRLSDIPVDTQVATLPSSYRFQKGHGVLLRDGSDAVCIAYGPVMLAEALQAADILGNTGISLAVVNLPWLNVLDENWFSEDICGRFNYIFSIDDHYKIMGQGDMLGSTLARLGSDALFRIIGVEEIPACGSNEEVLRYHKLDAQSLAVQISSVVRAA